MDDAQLAQELKEIRYKIGNIQDDITKVKVEQAGFVERISSLQNSFLDLQQKFIDYVTKHEFSPVKIIVYSMAGIVLTSVFVAIVKIVIVGG